jgi:hypothetical protein
MAAMAIERSVCVSLLALAVGCAGDDDCDELQPLVTPSSASEPGTLQAALRASDRAVGGLAIRSDGAVLCVLCDSVATLGSDARETGRFAADGVVRVAVAPDDAIYYLRATGAAAELVALSATGAPRWTAVVAYDPRSLTLVAGREGAYVGHAAALGLGVDGFDAATGATHPVWTGAAALLGAANGGVVIAAPLQDGSASLYQLDASGGVRWSHRIVKPSQDGFARAVETADGGALVAGAAANEVDLGDRTLTVPGMRSYVATFDAAGATQAAFGVTDYVVTQLARSAHGEIVLGGQVGGGYPEPADSFVSVAGPTGITRTLRLTGREDQVISALAPTADGAAWLQVRSYEGDDNRPTPELQVAGQTFAGRATYLIKLVP